MIFHRCDQCGKTDVKPLPITVADSRSFVEYALSEQSQSPVLKLKRDFHFCGVVCLNEHDWRLGDLCWSQP